MKERLKNLLSYIKEHYKLIVGVLLLSLVGVLTFNNRGRIAADYKPNTCVVAGPMVILEIVGYSENNYILNAHTPFGVMRDVAPVSQFDKGVKAAGLKPHSCDKYKQPKKRGL